MTSPLTPLGTTVYDLPPEVLTSLTLKTDVEDKEEEPRSPPPSSKDGDSDENLVGSQACSLCGLGFASVQDQRGHQKSDWHHYNLPTRPTVLRRNGYQRN